MPPKRPSLKVEEVSTPVESATENSGSAVELPPTEQAQKAEEVLTSGASATGMPVEVPQTASEQTVSAETKQVLEEPKDLENEEETQLEKHNSKLYVVGIAILALVVTGTLSLLIARFVFFAKTVNQDKVAEEVSTTETSTPTPTETSTIDKSKITFEVLNGSGISGLATKKGDELKALGYDVVKTGNAPKTATTNELYVVADQVIDPEVLKDVETVFSVASSSGEFTSTTAMYRIILGKE